MNCAGSRARSAGTSRVEGGNAVPGSGTATLRRSASPSWKKNSSSKISEQCASMRRRFAADAIAARALAVIGEERFFD